MIVCELSPQGKATFPLGNIFTYNKLITSFPEFENFTGMTTLNYNAFRETSIESIVLPTTITSLAGECFRSTNISSINLSRITSIEFFCFYNCTELVSVNISNCAYLGYGAFNKCTNLVSVGSVEKIQNMVSQSYGQFGETGLSGSFNFRSYSGSTIPNGLFNKTKVDEVIFPAGYTKIDGAAFDSTKITSFVVAEGCTTINNHAFSSNSSLQRLDLPTTITNLNGYFLYNNPSLQVLICRATTPPTIGQSGSLNRIDSNLKVYVPQSSISAYESAAVWSKLIGKYVALEGSAYK